MAMEYEIEVASGTGPACAHTAIDLIMMLSFPASDSDADGDESTRMLIGTRYTSGDSIEK